MFDIVETGAAAYDWILGKVKGMDTTDPVVGGTVNTTTNTPHISLALRTRNLHDRLKTIEDMLLTDSDSVINNLRDILDAFSGETEQVSLISLLARKACNVTTTVDKASWVAALEIAQRTYNLNATEQGTWVSGLGIDTIAANLATEASDRAQADSTMQQSIDDLDTSRAFRDGTNLTNITNWKSVLGIGNAIVRVGSTYVGDISTDKIVQCFFSALPSGTSYIVVGSLVGTGSNWDDDNDVMWIIRDKTLSSFKVAVREVNAVTQTLTFEWALIKI